MHCKWKSKPSACQERSSIGLMKLKDVLMICNTDSMEKILVSFVTISWPLSNKWLSHENDSKSERQTVLIFAYLGQRLRECVSLSNRFDTTEEQLNELSCSALEYYRVNALFVQSSVNPTVWTMGHVVPVHARQVFTKYGQGLGTVTMEGREAKHIFLKKTKWEHHLPKTLNRDI